MAICPKDGKACCDDLCYGGGCMQMPGAAMLETCAALELIACHAKIWTPKEVKL